MTNLKQPTTYWLLIPESYPHMVNQDRTIPASTALVVKLAEGKLNMPVTSRQSPVSCGAGKGQTLHNTPYPGTKK